MYFGKPAASLSKTRAFAVLGTDATVVQPYVDNLAAQFASDCLVIRHGSAELVDLAEAKLRGEAIAPERYATIMAAMLARPGGERVDTVVLACTHFPLVQEELAAAAPRELMFVDGKEGIARRVAYLASDVSWPDRPSDGIAIFTGGGADSDALRPALASYGLTRIETL